MPHILNVDEDRDSSAITTAVLTAAGFEVISASDGRSAIDTLASRAIDIIVLGDVSDLEPLEVCDRIKMSQATCDIPVVLLTAAHLTAADLTRALAAGVDQYLVQPVESEALIAILCGLFLRRLAQLEIRAAADRGETRLPRSEARYRSLITDAAIGIYQSTPDGRFRMVNPALVTMLGYDSVEELLNMPLTDIYANPDDRQRVLREFKGKTSARLEVPWKRKNGKLITVRLSGRVVTAQERGNDDVDKFEIFVEDVTERRELKHQLREMQKMEALGRFAGGAAHDYNNLLTVILGFADMLLDQIGTDKPISADLMEIRNAGERAAALTQQLLAFSRRQALRMTFVNVNEVLASLMPALEGSIGEGIEMRTCLAEDLPFVMGDVAQLEQILMNLVGNARDAMPSGGVMTIQTSAFTVDEEYAALHVPMKPGDYLQLLISDSGVGMDPETKSHVFEPFFTTKPRGSGIGLGLATVYGIVKQFGGLIWVNSGIGAGTTFTIHLPVVAHESVSPSVRPTAHQGMAVGTERILVVEDTASVRRLAVAALTRHGYRVVEAESGADALDTLKGSEEPFALLLTDVIMPGMNGRELAEHVRREFPLMPVLFMSGFTEHIIAEHGVLETGVELLHKPFTPRQLLDRVRELLTRPSQA